MTPEEYQEAAKHLEQIWIERERAVKDLNPHRGNDGKGLSTAVSLAIQMCLMDLQWEFELGRRLGPGPMTTEEAMEFMRQEPETFGMI